MASQGRPAAVPHTRMPSLRAICCLLAILALGVAFSAAEAAPEGSAVSSLTLEDLDERLQVLCPTKSCNVTVASLVLTSNLPHSNARSSGTSAPRNWPGQPRRRPLPSASLPFSSLAVRPSTHSSPRSTSPGLPISSWRYVRRTSTRLRCRSWWPLRSVA
jgi:hypothetical protein